MKPTVVPICHRHTAHGRGDQRITAARREAIDHTRYAFEKWRVEALRQAQQHRGFGVDCDRRADRGRDLHDQRCAAIAPARNNRTVTLAFGSREVATVTVRVPGPRSRSSPRGRPRRIAVAKTTDVIRRATTPV